MEATLIRGNERFRREVVPEMRELFQTLTKGQKPHTLLVTCSDSRLVPNLFTQTGPGELFVVRNAGNLVPPHGEDDAGGAAIEYALEALGVEHIAVCGHSGCGAMQAVVAPEAAEGLPTVGRWLRHAEPTRAALSDLPAGQAPLDFAVTHNARAQLENLQTHPSVRKRLAAGKLVLTAWVYDIGTGEMKQVGRLEGATS